MFSRHGGILSIASEFRSALNQLRGSRFEWLDCEGLERRHNIGKGSLIILDWMDPEFTHETRREHLRADFEQGPNPLRDRVPDNSVLLVPEFTDPDALWEEAKLANEHLGCEFFEGMVGRRVDRLYGFQLRNPELESCDWCKSRWAW